MSKDALVLSLGHNSSAILVRDNKIVCGYETERLTGVKSDSSFPTEAIDEILRWNEPNGPFDVYVSHWELFGDVNKMKSKHWDPSEVENLIVGGGTLFQTNTFFTHHDAHAWSAVAFAGKEFPQSPEDQTYLFVMDGFGTLGEHMSFYRLVDGIPVLLERRYGFGSSLGLLYQYTTAFLGMKQNQDEYKLLAFEAHVEELGDSTVEILDDMSESWSDLYRRLVCLYMEPDVTDPLLSIGALPNTAEKISNMLLSVVKGLQIDVDERQRRIACAYFTQKIVENVVQMFVEKYRPKNVLLVGGLFYNVKLNNEISKQVPGKTCIMPLAGDQGAGLGVYKSINADFEFPKSLCWGTRELSKEFFDSREMRDIGIVWCPDEDSGFEEVRNHIKTSGMVNLVRGAMEFGPRALCHTSTLAIPTTKVADRINRLNNRTNEMPFAPVMTEEQAKSRLEDCDKIYKSLDYMICTRDYLKGSELGMMGAAHRYPKQDRYSARPQVVRDHRMIELLGEFGPLINTSFNYHGVPIVCSDEQIRYSHVMERARSNDDEIPTTVVIGGK